MSRYLQEQCGWLLALLPGRVGRQTLVRFGWPAIAASQLREQADASGAALDEQSRRLAVLRDAATLPAAQVAIRFALGNAAHPAPYDAWVAAGWWAGRDALEAFAEQAMTD